MKVNATRATHRPVGIGVIESIKDGEERQCASSNERKNDGQNVESALSASDRARNAAAKTKTMMSSAGLEGKYARRSRDPLDMSEPSLAE